MKLSLVAGTTSKSVGIFVADSSSTTGVGLTGLAYNTASLTAYYCQPGVTAATAITLSTLASATAAWSSGGFVEISSSNMPGHYRLDIPNAALTGATSVIIQLKGATNMAPVQLEIELTAVNNQSATSFITGVNSIAPPANWNLNSIDSNGRVDVIKLAGTTQTARDLGAGIPAATPGAAGGLLIAGSNADTTFSTVTVSGATTLTGNVALAAGLTITQSTVGGNGISVTGNGTGSGMRIVAGSGTGGVGLYVAGGGTTGIGMKIVTTSGHGLVILGASGGHGIMAAGDGSNAHGLYVVGGTSGTCDGIHAVAGTGGVDIRGNLTGNITGTLSTLTTYTGNTPQTGDNYARIGANGAGLTALGDTRIANLDAAVTTRMASYTQPTGFLAATFPATIASTTNITAGTITTATNLTNAPTAGDLTATMKASVTTAATAATPTVTAGTVSDKTGYALAGTQTFNNTGTWTGNITGTVSTVTTLTNLPAVTTDWLTAAGVKADAVVKLQAGIPTDYQRRGVAVTLPSPAPSGYGGTSAGGGLTTDQATQLAGIYATVGVLSGPRSVTVSFMDANSGVAPLVEFEVLGVGRGRASSLGIAHIGLDDGDYTIVSKGTNGMLFDNVEFTVNGATAVTVKSKTSATLPAGRRF